MPSYNAYGSSLKIPSYMSVCNYKVAGEFLNSLVRGKTETIADAPFQEIWLANMPTMFRNPEEMRR